MALTPGVELPGVRPRGSRGQCTGTGPLDLCTVHSCMVPETVEKHILLKARVPTTTATTPPPSSLPLHHTVSSTHHCRYLLLGTNPDAFDSISSSAVSIHPLGNEGHRPTVGVCSNYCWAVVLSNPPSSSKRAKFCMLA